VFCYGIINVGKHMGYGHRYNQLYTSKYSTNLARCDHPVNKGSGFMEGLDV